MQYLSRAYQYYSGINPATLTGAIDVIVVEREDEASSETILACSPFHVRFGKLQVLRAGEKKVTLTVNSHPVPFYMKVGEAGEAFFVVETEEEVSDDLLTSPLLAATELNKKSSRESISPDLETTNEGTLKRFDYAYLNDADNKIQDERFGVIKDNSAEQEAAIAAGGGLGEEPDFLDLNALGSTEPVSDPTSPTLYPSPPPSPPLDFNTTTPRASTSRLPPTKPSSPTRSTSQPAIPETLYAASRPSLEEKQRSSPEITIHPGTPAPSKPAPNLSVSPSSLLSRASETAKTLSQSINVHSQDLSTYVSEVKTNQKLGAALDNVRHPFGGGKDEADARGENVVARGGEGLAEAGDALLPEVDDEQGQPPDVVYGEDVVIDMAGYKELDRHSSSSDDDEPTSSSQDVESSGLKLNTPSRNSRASTEPPPDVTPPPSNEPNSTVQKKHSSKHFVKTLRLSSDQLKSLKLQKGANTITFSVTSSYSGVATCAARVFLWEASDHIVISDIDGTITKSDALGHIFAAVGRDWTHTGVAKLYTDVVNNGYKIMYLTSRAIGQADSTRDYLKNIHQGTYQLPEGPVIMSPDRLMTSLHREVILRKPEVFKMACLRDLQRLFGSSNKNAFYAGFGNRITDALSYRSVNIPSSRIFTIDSNGEVKTELLELAGHKSSYIFMNDLVDQMFPSVHAKWTPEFTDFNFWRAPPSNIDLPDLSPPSPALSARSDTSGRLSVLRNLTGSLRGSRSATPVNRPAPPPSTNKKPNAEGDGHSNNSRPASPLSGPGWSSSDDEYSDDEGGQGRKFRTRTNSMPGSLPNSYEEPGYFDGARFNLDGRREAKKGKKEDEGEEDGQDGEGEDEDEDEANEGEEGPEYQVDFDEDLFATGEMGSVPF